MKPEQRWGLQSPPLQKCHSARPAAVPGLRRGPRSDPQLCCVWKKKVTLQLVRIQFGWIWIRKWKWQYYRKYSEWNSFESDFSPRNSFKFEDTSIPRMPLKIWLTWGNAFFIVSPGEMVCYRLTWGNVHFQRTPRPSGASGHCRCHSWNPFSICKYPKSFPLEKEGVKKVAAVGGGKEHLRVREAPT